MRKFLAAAAIAASLTLGLAVPALGAIDLTNTIPKPEQIENLPDRFQSVSTIIAEIFTVVIAISGAIFLVLLLVGGVMYLTGAGNEEATTKAKRLMIDAIIGLILVLAAYAIGIFILSRLGFKNPNVPKATPFTNGSSSSGGGALPGSAGGPPPTD